MLRNYSIVLLQFIAAITAWSQTERINSRASFNSALVVWEFSAFGGISSITANGNFRGADRFALPSRYANFSQGSGTDIRFPAASFGVRASQSLAAFATIQAGHSSVVFHAPGSTTIVNASTGGAIEVKADFAFNGDFYFAAPMLGLKYSSPNGFYAQIAGGVRLPISSNFSARETWSFPRDITAPASKEFSGNIKEFEAFTPIVETKVGIDLPLSADGNLRLVPAISANIASGNGLWRSFGLGADLGVQWRINAKLQIIYDTTTIRDTTQQLAVDIDSVRITPSLYAILDSSSHLAENTEIRSFRVRQSYLKTSPKPKPLLAADIGLTFIESSGKETKTAKVNVEQTIRRAIIPLLPYIFFDKNEFALPNRFQTSNENIINKRQYYDGDAMVLSLYSALPAIVARRLKKYPTAKLTITGFSTPDEQKTDSADELAIRRAISVRNAITKSGEIDTLRIALRSLTTASSKNAEQESESRRAEVASEQPEILAPVILTDTISLADPPALRFYPQVASSAGIASWRIELRQNDRLIRLIEGAGEPPEKLDWNMNDGGNKERLLVAPISYVFSATDADGQIINTKKQELEFTQNITQKNEANRKRSEFSVMCFNYDEANIAASSEGQIEYIRKMLPQTAHYTVAGTTDSLGNEAYNKDLSLRRARIISRQLGLSERNTIVIGLGEDASTFDNSLPEGRLYSRRVRIIVDYE